jgi:CTP synthase
VIGVPAHARLELVRDVRDDLHRDIGRRNVFYLHVSLIPYIGPAKELKTKPTQHSVATVPPISVMITSGASSPSGT